MVTNGGPIGGGTTRKTTGTPISDGLKRWLIASVAVLLASLTLFVGNIVAGFVYFNEKTIPLWVTVVGVIAVLGIATGFGGLLLVLVLAALKSHKDDKATASTAE